MYTCLNFRGLIWTKTSPNVWHSAPLVSFCYTQASPQEGIRDCILLPSLPLLLSGWDALTSTSRVSVPVSIWSIWNDMDRKISQHHCLQVPGQHSHDTMPSNSHVSLNLDSPQCCHCKTLVLPCLLSSGALLACFCYLPSRCWLSISWLPTRQKTLTKLLKVIWLETPLSWALLNLTWILTNVLRPLSLTEK